MGRHRLDPSAARIHRVAVMFTADEYERVQGAAASSRNLSSWLRELALVAVDDETVLPPLPDVDGEPTPGERRQQARAAEVTAQIEAVVGYLFDAVQRDDKFITAGQVAHHLNIDPAVAGRLIQRATGVSPVRAARGIGPATSTTRSFATATANTASAFLTKALSPFLYRYPATDQPSK